MKVSPAAWKNWHVTGALLGVVALSALGAAYWSNVTDRERYLQSRNFRLLAVLASQTSNVIDNRARLARDVIADREVLRMAAPVDQAITAETFRRWSAGIGRKLKAETARSADGEPTLPADMAQGEAWVGTSRTSPTKIAQELTRYRVAAAGDGTAVRIIWSPPSGGDLPFLSISLPASALLQHVFEPKLRQGAFDTLVLADPNGRVVYAVGRRAEEMSAMSVAALLPIRAGEARPDLGRFAETISEERVTIAGVDYRMFAQPCCRSTHLDAPVGPSPTIGFVVAGLTETDAMRAASLAISPVLVLLGVLLLMIALVGWPFLKCALMGVQQRVTRGDALKLALSSVFALALCTITLLTAAAYSRLSADVDAQLEDLATQLDERFTSQVNGAAGQLRWMTDELRDRPCVKAFTGGQVAAGEEPSDPCQEDLRAWSRRESVPNHGYPQFNAFALIDEWGTQRVKVAFSRATQRRVSVNERGYFQRARAGDALWTNPTTCPNGCYLESHWSWNTGQPQVVVSAPTRVARLPVAAVSIPMPPLLRPVLPAGFEFAIVDSSGQVHFHSDTQRNVHENLRLETDQHPRVRALIGAHGAGTLNTSYWGRPYRAYVRPTFIPGWSIVTLHEKQPTRALVLEWSAVALTMQAAYMVVCLGVTLLLMWVGASWLWPDTLRRRWYGALASLYAAALIGWLTLAGKTSILTTVWVGMLLPPLLWLVTYALLARRPAGAGQVKEWSEVCRDYRIAGTLLLVVTASLPAASFLALSSDLHVAAFLKGRQIALARAVDHPKVCTGVSPPTRNPSEASYEAVFYRSEVTCGNAADAPKRVDTRWPRHSELEDFIPYYTPVSADLRELMHDRSKDQSWVSERSDQEGLVVHVQASDPAYRLRLASPLPAVVGTRGLAEPSRVPVAVGALLLLLGIVGAAGAIVCFMLRRVALSNVVEPVRETVMVVTSVGQHLQAVCKNPADITCRLTDVHPLPLMPIVTASNVTAAWRAAHRAVTEAAPILRIAIPDLDELAEDIILMRRKMEILDEVMGEPEQTVLAVTRLTQAELASAVRNAARSPSEADRWARLLSRFSVTELNARGHANGDGAKPLSFIDRWAQQLRELVDGWRNELADQWTGLRSPDRWRSQLLMTEGQSHPVLERICRELGDTPAFKSGSLTRDQILEEIEERAAPQYRRMWQRCDEDERVVLEHVARHGLASAASRPVVRRLLARGLLRKDPELRLMSCSFQRFVLEAERRHEVAVLERLAEPSLWDRLRVPIATAAILALAFLVSTQREAFDATVSMAVGVSTAVPMLVKLTSLLTQVTGRSSLEPKANV
jgi:hypothetical protein